MKIMFTLKSPFCSSDMDSLVHDSRSVCSAIIPSDEELTPGPVSERTGVDWHSSTWDMAAMKDNRIAIDLEGRRMSFPQTMRPQFAGTKIHDVLFHFGHFLVTQNGSS